MSFDLRVRRGSRRDARARFERKPDRLAGCFGSLTPGPGIQLGSSIGEVSTAQIASVNLLSATTNPAGSALWTNAGTAALAADAANQWDAGFVPTRFTSNNGAADFSTAPTAPSAAIAAATQYTVSGQFSVDANLGFATPSTSARMAVNWTGGVAREDSITFNPATGLIQALSAGLTNPIISRFVSTAAGKQIQIVSVSFTTPATPAGTNAGAYRVYANINAGVAIVEGGAFQIELGTVASSFIPTPADGETSGRNLGVIPHQNIDHTAPTQVLNANYTYKPGFDSGSLLFIVANGVTLTLPSTAVPGEYVDVFISGSAVSFFTATAAAALLGPGFAPGGVVSATFPYDGATPAGGIGMYNTPGVRFTHNRNGIWVCTAIAETHGTVLFTGNGTFTPGTGHTRIWLDAAAGGGGGGGCAAVNAAGGGGGGGQSVKSNVLTSTPGSAISITIGTAGAGGAAGANNGTAGGNTIIGALLTLTGGALGAGAASGATGAGGAAGGANAQAGDAGQLIAGTLALGGEGGAALFGPAESTIIVSGANAANGRAGVGFGAGGGGGGSGAAGGTASGGNGTVGVASVAW